MASVFSRTVRLCSRALKMLMVVESRSEMMNCAHSYVTLSYSTQHKTSPKGQHWHDAVARRRPGTRIVVAAAGSILSLQPSPDAPSIWLAIAALLGLPAALWAYKVCTTIDFNECSSRSNLAPTQVPHDGSLPTQDNIHG